MLIYPTPGHYGDMYLATKRRTVYSPRAFDDLYVPTMVYPRHRIDTSGEENEIRRNVNQELMYTSNVVDDTYDLATRSRNRDAQILRDATRAIPTSSSADQSLPSASLKASAPPQPFRRFQYASSSRGPQSQENFEWKSPAARAYFNARNIRSNVRAAAASPLTSPFESPRSTPDRDTGLTMRRRKHRVLGSKVHLGKYHTKHHDIRTRKPPERYDDESTYSDGAEGYDSEDNYRGYASDDDAYSTNSGQYYVMREHSPSPGEYVPFAPRRMLTYEDSEDDNYGSKLGSLPDLAVQPYYSRSTEPGREGVANDILFHNVVAQTAARARSALRQVNLDDYDSASLVFSVEGELKDPRKGGEAVGFQYIARPIPLKGPMLATGPGSYAATSGTDSAFDKYFADMRNFREQIRQRLESGYQSLREASSTYRSKYYGGQSALPYTSTSYDKQPVNYHSKSYSYEPSHSSLSYRKRLEDGTEDRLMLYPLSQRESLPALPSTDPMYDHSEKLDLCEFGNELKLSTLDKIKIKAALVGNKVEVVLPSGHHRRPRSKYAASVIREMNLKRAHEAADQSLDTTPTETSHLHASSKPVYYESQARAHWDEFGEVVKPKNVLSWKYRLDARVSPDDLLYQPKTYTTIHSRLRDVHDKMDRHRQLMDRYLDANIKPHTEDFRNPNMFMSTRSK